jgi:hypothetical protein
LSDFWAIFWRFFSKTHQVTLPLAATFAARRQKSLQYNHRSPSFSSAAKLPRSIDKRKRASLAFCGPAKAGESSTALLTLSFLHSPTFLFKTLLLALRVTRLGELSPNGRSFTKRIF